MNRRTSQGSLVLRLGITIVVLAITLLFLFVGGDDELIPETRPIAPALALPAVSKAPDVPALSTEPVEQAASVESPIDSHRFYFAREDVMGTSFDLTVIADDQEQASAVEARVLEEIAKREKLISTYDAKSEISRINATPYRPDERIAVSYSLYLLLRECRYIHDLSDGAFSAYAGEAIQAWQQAAKTGQLPGVSPSSAAALPRGPGFKTISSKNKKYIMRLAPGLFQLDAIGKGYIIDKAVREAAADVSGIRGLRLNIGGEIKVWGRSTFAEDLPWPIAIADPFQPADNAAPLTRLEVRNVAVATSGDYARATQIQDRRINHILDPRNGQAVDHIRSATVVAGTAQRADALATALCVLTPEQGLRMIESTDTACLIVDRAGKQYRSKAFKALEIRTPPPMVTAWPNNHIVQVQFEIVRSERKSKFHRHYVGAWVEDESGRRVRILALWAKTKDIHYMRDLNDFWRDAWVLAGEGSNTKGMLEFSRATRLPGQYSLIWDGRDDSGQALPQGRYRIHLDVNREHGPPKQREVHTHAVMELDCGEALASSSAADQAELRGVKANYGPITQPEAR